MMIEEERYRDYKNNNIYMTSSGTCVVCVPVEYNGYDKAGSCGRWQDAHRELVMGLYIVYKTIPKVMDKMKELIGHSPTVGAIWTWLKKANVLRPSNYNTQKVYDYLNTFGEPAKGEKKHAYYKLGISRHSFNHTLKRWKKNKNAKAVHSTVLQKT